MKQRLGLGKKNRAPGLLPGKSRGRRSLVGCSPWGREESDRAERLHCHFSLSRTGEGNGNPLQCSCLENPRDGEARWAAIYEVAQSQTRLKRLSSSSSSLWETPRQSMLEVKIKEEEGQIHIKKNNDLKFSKCGRNQKCTD